MKIYCGDCNNNISDIAELLKKIELSAKVREWKITEFQAIPLYSKDWSGVGGAVPDSSGQRLFEFSERIRDEHTVVLLHPEFMALLENIRCVYDADISFTVSGQINKIKVLEGYIIEISGPVETMLQ